MGERGRDVLCGYDYGDDCAVNLMCCNVAMYTVLIEL